MSDWNELVLIQGKHEWIINSADAELVVKYRDKPEPGVIIKKSGGTWVKRENGIDYLCMNPSDVVEEDDILNELSGTMRWKPINDKDGKQVLEITDEIAKLRPIVVLTSDSRVSNLCTLYAVNGMEFPCVCYNHESDEYDGYVKHACRLATVSDLEDDHE